MWLLAFADEGSSVACRENVNWGLGTYLVRSNERFDADLKRGESIGQQH